MIAKPDLQTTAVQTALKQKYLDVRNYTEALCAPLSPEDYIPQPVEFISPPKWHLGHTTWFFEEMVLKPNLSDYRRFDVDFAYIFNSYYNSLGDRILRTNRGNLTRPPVKEVYDYRAYVDRHMIQLMDQGNLPKEIQDLIVLGLNHEQQHQELLITDFKYILGHNPLFPVYENAFSTHTNPDDSSGIVEMEAGLYEIGHQGTGFCYDNELGRHTVYLHPYSIRKALVTNGEYLEFIQDGGYEKFELWLDEGWAWVNAHSVRAPFYWHQVNGEWHHFTLGGLQKVHTDHVLAHINFFEAAAFAEWKGMRLPTEFEWEAASNHFPWGRRWEWTNSAYLPYPYFTTAEGAVGEYNGKFMVNQMVLRGASVATSPDHSRHTYRNFFHTHLRWQFTGIRLAKSI